LTILQRLGPSPVAEDQLISDLQLHSSSLTPALVELEMEGKVTHNAGGLLTRPI
jgi:DNA processing protein